MKNSNIISNYLKKQNHLNWKINSCDNERFSNIIVIPVIEEFANIGKLVNSLCANNFEKINKTLVLFVINNKKSSANIIKNDNFKSINFIKNLIEINDSFLKFGFIDCGSAGKELPEKDGGVGLARKIGMDLALSHFDY
ncbi:MAG: hypothetical protein KDC52_16890, partial [Ignavibacteriae bacterium]|nr:hypothetical protein [Ignavibacteriota bacterium]